MTPWYKNNNFWAKVFALGLYGTAIVGTFIAIMLDQDAMPWVLLTTTAIVLMRTEAIAARLDKIDGTHYIETIVLDNGHPGE